jgi:hypothetical protein
VSQIAQQSPHILKTASELRLQEFSLEQSPSLLWRQLVADQIDHLTEQLFIVVDGLDECELEERELVLNVINSMNPNAKMSWLIFSRYYADISTSLRGLTMCRPVSTAEYRTN